MKADIKTIDRGEPVSTMEPLLLGDGSRPRGALTDLALDLAQISAGFRRSLPHSLLTSLADLVRSMNCYYSNLIEGHDTHPVDIERALKKRLQPGCPQARPAARSQGTHRRAAVDRSLGLQGGLAVRAEGICEIHRRFCDFLPEDLLWVEDPATKERVQLAPGELRKLDLRVGNHVAVSPGAVPRFLERFAQVYGNAGKTESIISTAAAHHRLLWIHPFMDGNGRVARLMSHAMMLDRLDSGAVWSVARGLARKVQEYKRLHSNCDVPRRNDPDGRGALSEEALAESTQFFLTVLHRPSEFHGEPWFIPTACGLAFCCGRRRKSGSANYPPRSGSILEAAVYRLEVLRGDVDALVGTGERQARRIVSALLEKQVLVSESPRAPLRLAFPAGLAMRWMPGLFPRKTPVM